MFNSFGKALKKKTERSRWSAQGMTVKGDCYVSGQFPQATPGCASQRASCKPDRPPTSRLLLWEKESRISCKISQEISSVWLEVPRETKVHLPSPQCAGPAGQALDSHGQRQPVCVTSAVPGFLVGDRGPSMGSHGNEGSNSSEAAIGILMGAEGTLVGQVSCASAVSSESRRPCGVGGGCTAGSMAWLLRRARGAWSEL